METSEETRGITATRQEINIVCTAKDASQICLEGGQLNDNMVGAKINVHTRQNSGYR